VQAKFGDMVSVHFTCKFEDGTIFDSSAGNAPLELTIGDGSIMQGFENGIIGMQPGEKKTVHLPSEQGYGPHDPAKVKTILREEFPKDLSPEAGLKFKIKLSDGREDYITVTHVDESQVTLDGNHPLAGKDLIFDIDLLDIIKIGPNAEAYFRMGVLLQERNEFDEAIKYYLKAIAVDPFMTDAYYNMAVAYQKNGMVQESAECYQKVIEIAPNHEKAYVNLGISLKETGQYEEAAKYFEKALEIRPDYDIAYYNLGNISYFTGRFGEARRLYEKAVSVNPGYAEAHWNIALIDLLYGNYKDGWKGYEWRWKLESSIRRLDTSHSLWDGSDVKGKTILVSAEQGFGDTIQFVRYIPLIEEKGAQVILECQQELIPLLQNMKAIQKIVQDNSPLPEFDNYCPLLSLPGIFDTTLENIPAIVPYITVDPLHVKKWGEKLRGTQSVMKIGIAWAGNPELAKPYYNRSCSLESFSLLRQFDDINFYSLQKGEPAYDAQLSPEGLKIITYADEIHDFSDTAALIENLDLIISIDTSVAHLAGALGKPVWTLLPFIPDWRWLLNREDSPWYPTMRLFRQQAPGDWDSVIERVRDELAIFINNFKGA
jgi:FKBP-type peptidyl-prolyl cis-trans isomerase 2/predicted TPR repeat methyltransferase